MRDGEDIVKQLNQNVDAELQLCDPSETPYLCAQLQNAGNYEKIRKLVIERVMQEKINIGDAIAGIEAELDPNSID